MVLKADFIRPRTTLNYEVQWKKNLREEYKLKDKLSPCCALELISCDCAARGSL